MMEYDTWMSELSFAIAYMIEIDSGDAMGIIEAQPANVSNAWAKGLSAYEAARAIIG